MNRVLPRPIWPSPDPTSGWTRQFLLVVQKFADDLLGQVNNQVQGVGDVLASGSRITVTNPIHHVSGVGTIYTIDAPSGFTGPVWLIPDGGWSLGLGGNIATAVSARTSGIGLCLIYDGSLWYPVGAP